MKLEASQDEARYFIKTYLPFSISKKLVCPKWNLILTFNNEKLADFRRKCRWGSKGEESNFLIFEIFHTLLHFQIPNYGRLSFFPDLRLKFARIVDNFVFENGEEGMKNLKN